MRRMADHDAWKLMRMGIIRMPFGCRVKRREWRVKINLFTMEAELS